MVGAGSKDIGTSEHVEVALTFDQVQIAEVAALEIVARRAQLVELRLGEWIPEQDTGTIAVGSVDSDEHLYLGTGRTRGLLMISPELEDHVSQELQRETSAAKERRKMREERLLSRPTAPEKPEAAARGGKK